MKKNIPTIVLTGGGSGGHITPLISLAHELKRQSPDCQIIYIGLRGEALDGLQARYKVFDQVCLIPAGKFRRYHGEGFWAQLIDVKTLFFNCRDFFRVLRGIYAARGLLKEFRPRLVFSKGGYAAVPVGIAARIGRIPIITHDSDSVPGLANRIIGRWSKIHAVGQPIDNYVYPKETLRYVGIPVDERIKLVTATQMAEFKRQLGLPSDSLVMLVSGGGLGSGNMNAIVTEVAAKLLDKLPALHIILIAGQQHLAAVQERYESIPAAQGTVTVVGFTDEFYKYSGAADLILTRAGATTLAEFAIQNKACVVMPAAHLSGGHQLKNTKILEKLNAAVVMSDDTTPDKLFATLVDLLQNSQRREELAANLGSLAKPNAAKDLADILLQHADIKGDN